jgi:hypothetical protein
VLDDTLANAESQIQPAKFDMPAFKVFDNAQGVQIVIEAKTMLAQGFVEGAFAGVSKGRMANVMNQGKRFGKCIVKAKRRRDRPRDLRHLHGVGEAAAEVVGVAVCKDLGLAGKAPEGPRMNDARSITREG